MARSEKSTAGHSEITGADRAHWKKGLIAAGARSLLPENATKENPLPEGLTPGKVIRYVSHKNSESVPDVHRQWLKTILGDRQHWRKELIAAGARSLLRGNAAKENPPPEDLMVDTIIRYVS